MDSKGAVFCKYCKEEISGNFCSNCGQPLSLNRIDGKYILTEVSRVLNFDRGFLYTVKRLLIKPGETVRDFLENDRRRLVKPVVFLLFCSVIYALVQQWLHFEDTYYASTQNEQLKDSYILVLSDWMRNHYGFTNIIMAIFMAPWLRWFYKKAGYNIYENLILLFFLMGMGMLIATLFGMVEGIFNLPVFIAGTTIAIAYSIWGIGQFFPGRRWVAYLKATLVYAMGYLSIVVVFAIIGILLDIVLK